MSNATTPDVPAIYRFRGAAFKFLVSHSALFTCGLFLIVGVAVLDDYGISADEDIQRWIGQQSIAYILGDRDALPENQNRYYGVAFEVPLVVVERLFGLEDSRTVFLSRHLLTHLFFLASGFCCSLLVYRLFNSRMLALFALLLFLLHPRMYAHSFFNSKDLPFLCMFMISLYLSHRAFKKDTVWAFLLCGAGVAIFTNIRVLGVMLFAGVLALRALDFFCASGRDERRHILITTGTFILASVLILYVSWPLLWSEPAALVDAFAVFSRFPNQSIQLFGGDLIPGNELPPHYIPTWISITTPPVALLLGLIGAGSILYRGMTHPRDVLRNTNLRFGFLLIACLALPILAVVVTEATLYDGWRQMFFLYAPLSLLAVFGLHWLTTILTRRLSMGVYALAAIGLAVVVVQMVLIHPHQMVYFNFLVDRTTPGYLRTQYDMEYWGPSHREALEYLLERYPDRPIYMNSYSHTRRNRAFLPEPDRQRVYVGEERVDFFITNHREHWKTGRMEQEPLAPVYTRQVYNNTILTVASDDSSLVDEATIEELRRVYRSAVSGEPVFSSKFNVYLADNAVTYTKEPCSPADSEDIFFLHVHPVDKDDLPQKRKQYGFDNLDFAFIRQGVRFDGKCLARRRLPEYEISSIVTGQWIAGEDRRTWQVEVAFTGTEEAGQ